MNVNWSKHFRELGVIGSYFGEEAYIIINRAEDAHLLRASNVRLDVSQWDSTGLVPHLWGTFVCKSDGEYTVR